MSLENKLGSSTPNSLPYSKPDVAEILLTHLSGQSRSRDIPAYSVIEWIASHQSSTVFLYDLAEDLGFGALTKEWAEMDESAAKLVSLQTRAGAGLTLVGRLHEGTSNDIHKGSTLTAYTTPQGLAHMAFALAMLPKPSTSGRLIIQVAGITPVGPNLVLSPTLAPLFSALYTLPASFVVLLSSTPQESVELATVAYLLPEHHVVHVFDHHSSARETTHLILPSQSKSPAKSVQDAFAELGYGFYDYTGDNEAQIVLVLLNGPLAAVAKVLASQISGIGVLVVRVLRPWDEAAFRSVLPTTAKVVHVMDDVPSEAAQGGLFVDVFGTLFDPTLSNSPTTIQTHRNTPQKIQDYISSPTKFISFLMGLAPLSLHPVVTFPTLSVTPTLKRLLFFSTATNGSPSLSSLVTQTFLPHRGIKARHLSAHDAFSKPGGLTADRIILSSNSDPEDYVPVPWLLPLSPSIAEETEAQADFVAVLDQILLKTHSVLKYARRGAPVLVLSSWKPEEILSAVPFRTLELIRERSLRLCFFDAKGIALEYSHQTDDAARQRLENVLVYLAFLRLYIGQGSEVGRKTVEKLARASFGDEVEGIELIDICAKAWETPVSISVPPTVTAALDVDPATKPVSLKEFEHNMVVDDHRDFRSEIHTHRVSAWHDAAQHIMFREAFAPLTSLAIIPEELRLQDMALRPDLPERTYLITTMVNRRLTPKEYHRNLFHLEFDTKGTGLRYNLGEALGIHGWNDATDVLDFCNWYGVNIDQLITILAPGRGDGKEKLYHTRTVFQALQQQIDLFGRPPKSFYAALSVYATQMVDKMALHFISSPEGSAMFKKLADVDTVTFADVLKMYPSARPSVAELCELVGDIVPRHYSIASSQEVVGDRVDLLIVTVDWVTPSGSLRYGQCTRYLCDLKLGQKVTVSIKPSVMKLPPSPLQPIIMAGLGTGAAPFRAFMQHRAWLVAQNIPVGPLIYYFGSRHRSQEYIYGEEIEAYLEAKVLTHVGLAFSRDGNKKVYIQHKMKQDAAMLVKHLSEEKGVFYLCGPTWPVADIHETLVDALVNQSGKTEEEAAKYIEDLKGEQRYVLEVY